MTSTAKENARSRHAPPPDTRTARLVLNAIPDVGPVSCRRLADALGGDPVRIFHATRAQLVAVKGINETIADTLLSWRTVFDPAVEFAKIEERGWRFVTPEDGDGYPPLLREIYDPPLGLYATGEFKWGARCVAIVGSRRITSYGKMMARTLARELAASGWCIVSGMARGVDTEAHQGALEVGGATVAVLGNGLDIVYPPENLALYRKIAQSGVVMSEFPLGRGADRRTFPMRNRIVTGISRAVIVIESDIDGGSMISARFAGEQNRTVCAVPGRADSPQSKGCHALIRDGATLVTCADEILEELGERTKRGSAPKQQELFGEEVVGGAGGGSGGGGKAAWESNPNVGDDERKVLRCLTGGTALGADALAEQTGISAEVLMGKLLMMELDRLVTRTAGGAYEVA
ncbi:MAG: DNA-processing protein DprA [Puniceicoccales bacterium]|jgi:DNA processing protein|nr:DNA-processing protein DprA [Puniceicoccales bacterium]